jgi:dGTPase
MSKARIKPVIKSDAIGADSKSAYTSADFERKFHHTSTQKNRWPFEIDKGRIIHSASFRRLQGKTQVLGVGERDFYRTRLTHSLEVAQLGRGMCVELPGDFHPDPDLVEAICLAHDIGHPPFGHFGEDILHRVMLRYGGFGANPQNIRLVTFLEAKYDDAGLDLSRATLDGLVKYPALFDPEQHPKKPKFTYAADKQILDWIKKGVQNPNRKPIEGEIADWADQVAYCVNDLEDTLRAGLLSFVDMHSQADEISKAAKADVGENNDDESVTDTKSIKKRAEALQKDLVKPMDLRQRKINLKQWTSETIKELLHDVTIKMTNPEESSIRYKYSLTKSNKALSTAAVLKATVRKLVFDDPRVKTLEYKGGRILGRLFQVFRKDPRLLPLDFQQLLESKRATKERLVADFVSGMTDRYAYSYYNRLFQPGSGSFYEDV